MSATTVGTAGRIDPAAAAAKRYDAVVVGSGVSGAIIANELSQAGFAVLVLEAGPGHDMTLDGYEAYLNRFYTAVEKDNNSAYARIDYAPMPRTEDVRPLTPGQPDATGYLVQNGPFPLESTYTRVVGGTTMHWEGKALRMLPEDFQTRTLFGQGRDWPFSYRDLMPYYTKAEFELGVSADVEDQAYLGIEFDPGYVFPMRELPASYLDQAVARGVDGSAVRLRGESYRLNVRTTPQARNSMPHPGYAGGKGYTPVGAVSTYPVNVGERCQGNINCVPLCPVQAKYNANKTMAKALTTGRVDLLNQAVASKIVLDQTGGTVSHIEVKTYDLESQTTGTVTVKGRVFVLAANAVENARLMLASGLPNANDQIGRNLMDHPFLLNWGLMPEVTGTMRGSQSTSGIEELRGGPFRREQAAFRVSIHNDGWGWSTGAPYTQFIDIVDNQNQFGKELRRRLVKQVSCQLQLAIQFELMPDPNNRVTVDPRYTDRLGNPRPVLTYRISDYALGAVAYARQFCQLLFRRLGVEDHTRYDPRQPWYLEYQGQGYEIRGGNHWSGSHIMGTDRANSVVDPDQRCWDHPNLYPVGGGSMPTIGTSNTTLTVAAICFRTAEHLRKVLA
ncbi:MAG TPA: GMC family oxidoreductase [Urbifossiella sp.]|jgi:choline dehydrogenase-like flavoprotein|nr:GMC family oxidoreductase [Urbifossiella sp.]